ncbi:MAG: response regulator transcription factor [Chloroflexi bacterium]|nr:response regulator transcription factor [Chloroflexota bacterium]
MPGRTEELDLRVQRLLGKRARTGESDQVKSGDLVIDVAKCEVTVDNRPIMLTFKEYQLLKFLASSPGRVFTRETLLNKVWGYEYYGGDRTVDVHIKRLRSKIEDANHSFIETVRNIGYRFRDDL